MHSQTELGERVVLVAVIRRVPAAGHVARVCDPMHVGYNSDALRIAPQAILLRHKECPSTGFALLCDAHLQVPQLNWESPPRPWPRLI